MKPETGACFKKARTLLARAPALLANGWPDEAGRAAYLAGFHAAQALLFERRGRVAKTHSGVQAAFAELVKDEPTIDQELRRFLARAYALKALADYETGAGVAPEQARVAIERAGLFIAAVAALIPADPGPREAPP